MGIQCCLPPNKPKVLCLSKAAMNSPVGWFFSCFSVLNAHSKLKQLWGEKISSFSSLLEFSICLILCALHTWRWAPSSWVISQIWAWQGDLCHSSASRQLSLVLWLRILLWHRAHFWPWCIFVQEPSEMSTLGLGALLLTLNSSSALKALGIWKSPSLFLSFAQCKAPSLCLTNLKLMLVSLAICTYLYHHCCCYLVTKSCPTLLQP